MNKSLSKLTWLFLFLSFVISCKKDNPTPPTIIQFANSSIVTPEFGGQKSVGITFSTPLQSDISLTINVSDSTSVYGKDYTTSPDGSSGTITLKLSKGATQASFDFIPVEGPEIKANRIVRFTLFGKDYNSYFGPTTISRVTIVDDASIIQFASPTLSATEFGGTKSIELSIAPALQADLALTISVTDSSTVYNKDYTTAPDGSSKIITLQIPKGATKASFDFVPIQGLTYHPKRSIKFAITGHYSKVQFGPIATVNTSLIDEASVAQFTSTSSTLFEYGTAKTVVMNFTSPITSDGNIKVNVADSTALYGSDYTTIPDGTSKVITVPVAKGATSASFIIQPSQKTPSHLIGITNFSISGLAPVMQYGSNIKFKASVVNDLISYLPMQGNALDASYFANATTVGGATLVTGHKAQANTAYNMDGISNYIKIANSTALDTIKSKITLTAWVKPSSFYGGNYTIIEKAYSSHTNPYYQYKLGLTGDQYPNVPGSFLFCLSINNTYTPLISPAGTWSPGNWYFVVGTYDGANMILYVNGNQVAKLPMTGKIDHFGTDIFLGKVNNLNLYTIGTIGDIRIYNRALTATEVSSLYTK